MCGICGLTFADPDQPVDRELLQRMTATLQHRGPDSRGFHVTPGIGLGIQRLRIIDLQTGDQPIANEDGTITIVCNGEIYNSQELCQRLLTKGHRFSTQSDVEVIVHLYEEYGVDCVEHLQGMFAFALWDARQRRLLLARDRLGIKPLYYAVDKDALYFGSELKAILATNAIDRQLDLQALRDLFTFGFILTPKTLLSTVCRLPPGHYLSYQAGQMSVHQYWELTFPAQGSAPVYRHPHDWAEAVQEKLSIAVRRHIQSNVPIGAWLSPGIDSSGVVSLMTRLTSQPVQTFSLTFDQPDDEVRTQRMLHQYAEYNVLNQQVTCTAADFSRFPQALWHQENPSTTGMEVLRLRLSEVTAQQVTVVLTGEGSDELFGGYARFLFDKLLRPFAWLPLPLRRLMLLGSLLPTWKPRFSHVHLAPQHMNLERYAHMVGLLEPQVQDSLFSADLRHRLAQMDTNTADSNAPSWRVSEQFQQWHPLAQLQYYECKIRLPDWIFPTLDALPMAYGLEARVPFLDDELVALCTQIPPSLKLHGVTEKYILRKALQSVLPTELAWRKKRGLAAPLQNWLRQPLPNFAAEALSAERIREKGYFDPTGVANLLAQHRAGKDYGMHVLGVLALHVWDDLFLQGISVDNY